MRKMRVLQRTERLAFDPMKTMRWGIKGARVRDLSFYCHATLPAWKKVDFNHGKVSPPPNPLRNSPAIWRID